LISETLRLWAEMSGIKILDSRPHRDGWIVNDTYYIRQIGGDIHESKRTD